MSIDPPLTRRDNLRRVLRTGEARWTPCTINLAQWFKHHQRNDSLPAELQGCADHLDVMLALGCDVFTRNVDAGVRLEIEDAEIEQVVEDGPLGPRHIHRTHTPHGVLQAVREEQVDATTSYDVEDPIKDWTRDRAAYLWAAERWRWSWRPEIFLDVKRRVGDAGLVMIPAGQTPLKKLHLDFGLDGTCLFVLDEPGDARAICDLHWQKLRPVLVEIAEHPETEAAILMDNVDAPFLPPEFAERYWTPYVADAAAIFQAHGKSLFVHACGQLKRLREAFIEAGVHGLEGMAHPPLGDWTLADAKAMPAPFITNGGFSATEQVSMSDREVDAFYDGFFRELDGFGRFIFAAACQTTPQTPWSRIRRVVELCRQHAGTPDTPPPAD